MQHFSNQIDLTDYMILDSRLLTLDTINQINMSHTTTAAIKKQQEQDEELDFNYKEEREEVKLRLRNNERIVRKVFNNRPHLIELKNLNELVRWIWKYFSEDIPVGSITRIARKLRATGEFDTEENQRVRANCETAHRKYFRG